MIIAFDFDDTLVDTFTRMLEFFNERYCEKFQREQFTSWRFNDIWKITRKQWLERWCLFDQSESSRNLVPMVGVHDRLVILAKHHQLHIVTSRPIEMAAQTKEIINRLFPGVFLDIHFCSRGEGAYHFRSKSQVCHVLGATILFEDRPDHAAECAEAGIKIGLIQQPWNRQEKFESPLVMRVASWQDEVVEIIFET